MTIVLQGIIENKKEKKKLQNLRAKQKSKMQNKKEASSKHTSDTRALDLPLLRKDPTTARYSRRVKSAGGSSSGMHEITTL